MKGFTDTMAEIAPDVEIIEYATAFTREDGLKDMADILTANPQIDAVYSLDDETSIGALQAIEDAGVPTSRPSPAAADARNTSTSSRKRPMKSMPAPRSTAP